jgi:hypothetical protein
MARNKLTIGRGKVVNQTAKSWQLSEYQEQCIVADYLRKRWPKVLFTATLGGVYVGIGSGKKLKKQGYLKGVPDLLICKPTKEAWIYTDTGRTIYPYSYIGLAIEMKVGKGGVVSDDQKRVMAQFEREGWKVLVAHGADEAIKAIEEYLK